MRSLVKRLNIKRQNHCQEPTYPIVSNSDIAWPNPDSQLHLVSTCSGLDGHIEHGSLIVICRGTFGDKTGDETFFCICSRLTEQQPTRLHLNRVTPLRVSTDGGYVILSRTPQDSANQLVLRALLQKTLLEIMLCDVIGGADKHARGSRLVQMLPKLGRTEAGVSQRKKPNGYL